jgi:hypothetical protein
VARGTGPHNMAPGAKMPCNTRSAVQHQHWLAADAGAPKSWSGLGSTGALLLGAGNGRGRGQRAEKKGYGRNRELARRYTEAPGGQWGRQVVRRWFPPGGVAGVILAAVQLWLSGVLRPAKQPERRRMQRLCNARQPRPSDVSTTSRLRLT